LRHADAGLGGQQLALGGCHIGTARQHGSGTPGNLRHADWKRAASSWKPMLAGQQHRQRVFRCARWRSSAMAWARVASLSDSIRASASRTPPPPDSAGESALPCGHRTARCLAAAGVADRAGAG
jgi:hypothetical protein